jgi:hypothetical protein
MASYLLDEFRVPTSQWRDEKPTLLQFLTAQLNLLENAHNSNQTSARDEHLAEETLARHHLAPTLFTVFLSILGCSCWQLLLALQQQGVRFLIPLSPAL